jgi:Fic family protein
MDDLVTWYNKTITEHPHPILVATEFNFRFLAIHPFQDGNGRLGRALFILALLQSGDKYLPTIAKKIAIDRNIEKRKSEYYLTLHKVSNGKFNQNPKGYKLDLLAWYFIKVIEDSLNDIEFYKIKHRNLTQLTEASMQILNCFKASPEKRMKLSELEQETKLNRRTIQHSLTSLVEKGFLQRLGQKKGSRYQLVF